MRTSEINMLSKMGLSEREIRALAKSIKGQVITVGVGSTSASLQIGGNAEWLLGFRMFDPGAAGVLADIMINQEIIFTTVQENLLDSVLSAPSDEYIETLRKIKPMDVFNITFNSAIATTVNVMVFYLVKRTN